MAIVSFVDDNLKLVDSVIKRDYSFLQQEIIDDFKDLDEFVRQGDCLCGYKISVNEPLTNLYGFTCFVVRFVFAAFDTHHTEAQKDMLVELLNKLRLHMDNNKGYYNLRVPAHFIDITKAANEVLKDVIICGGTVELYTEKHDRFFERNNDINIFIADNEYILNQKDNLVEIAHQSFDVYQGQYHISHVLDSKAGTIYENWIANAIEQKTDDVIFVAEYQNEPIGFLLTKERYNANEVALGAVGSKRRKLGAYKNLMDYHIEYSCNDNKAAVTSTQFENYISWTIYTSLGMKPFYSIYNYHIDKR